MGKSAIVIVDYGIGNVGSIHNMLKHVGFDSVISHDPQQITNAGKLIIAGVGAFDAGISRLRETKLLPLLHERVNEYHVPVLGICLGMQLLANRSEEGQLPGLGWINGEAKRFNFSSHAEKLRVPHMGWNSVKPHKDSLLLSNLPDEARFYFVHSYYCLCNDAGDVLTTTHYGHDFVSAIERNNIFGVQFHPEKSHKYGMKLLENFARL